MIKLAVILLTTAALLGGSLRDGGNARRSDSVTAPVDLIDPPQR